MPSPAVASIAILLAGSLLVLVAMPKYRMASLAVFPISMLMLVLGVGNQSGAWWSIDRIGLMLGIATLLIGACAYRYTQRQFQGELRGRHIEACSLLTVAAVLATDLAANQAALIISWVATSVSVVLLLWAGTGSWRVPVVRRAMLTFMVTDGILLLGVLVATVLPGQSNLTTQLTDATGIGGVTAAVLLTTAALAAMGRAGLTTRSSWVTATISTPSSVSALLHAGVVNAGALLLLRFQGIAGSPWWLAAIVAGVCAAVMAVLAPRIHSRVDLKGQLATSTISQMAFMLLALALGWPVLALTHLVGHGLYKAGRFMATSGAIESRSRLRIRAQRGNQLTVPERTLGAAFILTFAGVIGIGIGLHGDVLAAMGVVGPGAAVVWWVRTSQPVLRPLTALMSLVIGLTLYAGFVGGAEVLLEQSMPHGLWQAPWWTLGAVVGLVTMITAARRYAPLPIAAPSLKIPQSWNRQNAEVSA